MLTAIRCGDGRNAHRIAAYLAIEASNVSESPDARERGSSAARWAQSEGRALWAASPTAVVSLAFAVPIANLHDAVGVGLRAQEL